MKKNETQRAAMLVAALGDWRSLQKVFHKRGSNRGLEFLIGKLHIDEDYCYVEDHDASVVVDCKTGAIICEQALKTIRAELKKLGVQ